MDTNEIATPEPQLVLHPVARRGRFVPRNIYELRLDELEGWCHDRGEATYRARQLYRGVYQQLASGYDDDSGAPEAVA